MSFAAGFCLLLIAVGASSKQLRPSICFPAFPQAAAHPQAATHPQATVQEEGRVDSQTARLQFPEGLHAVHSVANVVLRVLSSEPVRVSPKNWAVSPLSLAATIAQLLLGSRGHLQSALTRTLSLDQSVKPTSRLEVHRQLGDLMRYLERAAVKKYTLELSGAVFIQPSIVLKPEYKRALDDFYNAQLFLVDFSQKPAESTEKINNWVRDSTHGKLPNLFSQSLPPTTVSVMANVVYFNGRWQMPFVPQFTRSSPFYVNSNRKVDTEFMFGEKEILYKNTSELQLIGIPYKNWEVVLYILLPHDHLQSSLSVNHLDELISTAVRENVTLAMPKLKLFSTISVKQSILRYIVKNGRSATRTAVPPEHSSRRWRRSPYKPKAAIVNAGVAASFNQYRGTSQGAASVPAAAATLPPAGSDDAIFEDAEYFDVGGASEDSRFKFNDVIHQVSLEIDEKGSEIAAVTAGLVDYSGAVLYLYINRPFFFFIRHEVTSAHLFWGRIADPTKHTN